jgi:hypothetical protein
MQTQYTLSRTHPTHNPSFAIHKPAAPVPDMLLKPWTLLDQNDQALGPKPRGTQTQATRLLNYHTHNLTHNVSHQSPVHTTVTVTVTTTVTVTVTVV